jgi:hypothetical protein
MKLNNSDVFIEFTFSELHQYFNILTIMRFLAINWFNISFLIKVIISKMVKVEADGKTFQFNDKVNNLTTYFKDLKEFEGEKDKYVLKTIRAADVDNVFQACTKVDYQFKTVTKVSGSDANAYIGDALAGFFKGLSSNSFIKLGDQINTLYKAAKELRIKGLENNIAAFLASKVYIKSTAADYQNKKN